MRKQLVWWKLVSAPLTLAGSGAILAAPALVAQESKESFTVSPKSLTGVKVLNPSGDLDNRKADPDSKEGLLWVAPGDSLDVTLTAPGNLKGMVGSCKLNYAIREEYERNCRKRVIHHPRTPPVSFG